MTHWANSYIGKPYAPGLEGLGPDAYDCSGLIRAVLTERFGISFPVVPEEIDREDLRSLVRYVNDFEARENWAVVKKPWEGDVAELSHSRYPHHVGIWLDVDGGGVLHAVEGSGVIFSSPTSLNINGWYIVGYRRHYSRMGELCEG